jgi:hypothetical protein
MGSAILSEQAAGRGLLGGPGSSAVNLFGILSSCYTESSVLLVPRTSITTLYRLGCNARMGPGRVSKLSLSVVAT